MSICTRPLTGHRTPEGAIIFKERLDHPLPPVIVSCGQCVRCRLERARQWSVRCIHEKQMHSRSSFVTLTYDDDNLPPGGTLLLSDWQNFAKKLRRDLGPFRFFMCGEYGDTTGRPHFHALLFGLDWPDQKRHSKGKKGDPLFTSKKLDAIWQKGFATIGEVTFESAGYCARYIMKKVTGPRAEHHYNFQNLDGTITKFKPEFTTMSRRPGLGKTWIEQFMGDVYPHDEVIVRGRRTRPPKFYDTQYERQNPGAHAELLERRRQADHHQEDQTEERLREIEDVTNQNIRHFTRHN